ncbi:MAG: Type II adenine specific DNA methyltransferase [Parcubacteria group bacterium GW2011_GWA1_42_7]|nr:MAG: Type II adenine specific DNA methyltransferase [Parcubacteria group bacterium GW2011_GWA1_42_7]
MLTKKQKKILDYIEKYIKIKEYSPTLKEIKNHFDLSSVSNIHQHIQAIEKKGYLKKEENQPRSIEPYEFYKEPALIKIPLIGIIAAGQPIEAIEIPGEDIFISKKEIKTSFKHYALKVQGNSMVDEGIFDGDIVIIREQKHAENGQTVVAIIDNNAATLKKIYKEKKRFRLQPANQSMLPLFREEVEVRGIVIKVIRNLEEKNQINTFSYKKQAFLNQIKSSNQNSINKYKRVTETPIRYAGGKSLGVGFIVELLPDNIKKIISPFFGGGSIEIACNKHLGLEIKGYDIFDILVNYWNVQINEPEKLFKKLSEFNPNQTTYKQVKESLKRHWKGEKKMPSMDLAAHYYFNHNLSYGPGFLGWPSRIYLNKDRYKKMIEKVRNFSTSGIDIKCASFENIFERYPNDFFYCDPPYLLGEDTKMFRGIYPMRNIPIHHNGFKHEKLRDLLKQHKGGFILSYNNCPTIRNWYKEFAQHFPQWQYTMGQGETRIGLNRKNSNNNHIKESHEILICCPPKV